jgi:hypothetical protein
LRVNIGKRWQKKLARLPEGSMGAQHVDIVLSDGKVLVDVPVFNGEDCEVKTPFDTKSIVDVRLHTSSTH